ncbi:MAG: ATP-binding protein [Chlamydiales bacterium]|nr:ATP-binding protein [Chlamydiales bacterium]
MPKKQKIIGRIDEQILLQEALRSRRAEMIALYGRRRVGKTFLIKTYFESQPCSFAYVSGMKDGKLGEQLTNFKINVERDLAGISLKQPQSWMEAFDIFSQVKDKIDPKKKIVLFLDELPWLATRKSRLLQALDYYWNQYWSHDSRFKLIICGSAASWIIRKIIKNKGGLYNRVTRQIRLDPFTLKETKEFLKFNGVNLNNRQILELYMVTGGIPYYLNHIQKGISAAQNISEMAFSKQGILYQDFDNLFASLFEDSDNYHEIVRVISDSRYGIEQDELIKKCKALSQGGSATRKLQDLEEAGFIVSFVPKGHRRKGIYFRVIDEYTVFYLKWIDPHKRTVAKLDKSKNIWLLQRDKPAWKSWSGYAFESICLKHVAQIRDSLKITSLAEVSSWRHDGKKEEEGAQVDLLFDRSDESVTICEIKHTEQPFLIDKSYYQQLKRKIDVYKKVTKTHKEIFLVFIASSGLKKNLYSEEYVSGVVTLEDLFR